MSTIAEKFPGCNSEYAGLALVWDWLKSSGFLRCLNYLGLPMKTVKRTPQSKLQDLLACLMAGVECLGQIDPRMRRDEGLIRALGRESLADQSLLSQTLDAFDDSRVERLRRNLVRLLRQRSRTLKRIDAGRLTMLDLDMTDLPCSRRCEGALKGRTTGKRGRTVRQLSVVYCFRYREPLDAFLHPGNVQSAAPLEQIVGSLEQLYQWKRSLRRHICWRLDSGYGSDAKVSWMMRRGYRLLAKGLSNKRAAKWAQSVPEEDWRRVHRTQDVFENEPVPTLSSPHRCFLIRTHRSKFAGYCYSYLVGNLERWVRPRGHVLFYNERQGIEKEIQQIKSVLGLKHKRKRSFCGMEALALLTLIANLALVWFRRSVHLDELGLKRFIRDVVKTPGIVRRTRRGLTVDFHPEVTYYQQLTSWQRKTVMPLFSSQSGGILYKN